MDVFADAGADVCANVAVITQFDGDPDYMENSTLRIGDQVRVPVNGYMSGADGIFCCILTDAEYAYLKNGAKVTVLPPDYMESASFENSPYAAVQKGTGGTGIVDTDGTFVVQPVYKRIYQWHVADHPTTLPMPFFCVDDTDAVTVLDGKTLDIITQYAITNDYLSVNYINPSVFEINDGRGKRILSLATGDKLIDIPYTAEGDYVDGILSIDGWYRCMADGYPTRLVLNDLNGAHLITLTGETASQPYQRITPLIWKGDRGAFLVEVWDPSNDQAEANYFDDQGSNPYFERGKTLTAANNKTGWCCGLMDENGEIIVPIEYTSVEVTDDLTVSFGGAGNPVSIAY